MAIATVWLVATVGVGLAWWAVTAMGAGLSDAVFPEGIIRFMLIGGAFGTIGFLGVWMLRRTRPWLIAAAVFALWGLATTARYLLE